MNHAPTTTSTVGSLLAELKEESTTLLRQEIALAKAELNEKAERVGRNTFELALGGALAYSGLIILLIGLSLLLSHVFTRFGVAVETAVWLGPIVVGLLVALAGTIMLVKAKKIMSADRLFPSETVESLNEDKRWIQHKLSQHHS
ncbi:MAG: hypothetical protein K0R17_1416 [Rariglobus sp.]|jgi:hypothetical protein|nr:hypothetical protein [Rariglobus sp.]